KEIAVENLAEFGQKELVLGNCNQHEHRSYKTRSVPDRWEFHVHRPSPYQWNKNILVDTKGLEYGRYVITKVLDTVYQGFLRVWTTFDIFKNILFPYSLNMVYCLLLDTAYRILFPSWSLVPLRLQRANRLFGPRLVKCPVGLFDDENGKHTQDDSDESDDDDDDDDENKLSRLRRKYVLATWAMIRLISAKLRGCLLGDMFLPIVRSKEECDVIKLRPKCRGSKAVCYEEAG
nr:hypothetical protein [Tanacetum cinerariifolium]